MAANMLGRLVIPYYDHLLKLLETSPELKHTAKGIVKQMAYAATGAGIGGVVGGPLGALVGTTVGGLVGYLRSDPYESMLHVLRGLTDEEKRELVAKVQSLVGGVALEQLTSFITKPLNRDLLIGLVNGFAHKIRH